MRISLNVAKPKFVNVGGFDHNSEGVFDGLRLLGNDVDDNTFSIGRLLSEGEAHGPLIAFSKSVNRSAAKFVTSVTRNSENIRLLCSKALLLRLRSKDSSG